MKNKVILFIIGLVALITFQAKVVMPIVYDVASSGLFMEDSEDEKKRSSEINPMTEAAYTQCNKYVTNELLPDFHLTFSTQPINAFSLGNYRYIINADIEILPNDEPSFIRRYVCRIQFQNDNDIPTDDPENWVIEGISGLNDI